LTIVRVPEQGPAVVGLKLTKTVLVSIVEKDEGKGKECSSVKNGDPLTDIEFIPVGVVS